MFLLKFPLYLCWYVCNNNNNNNSNHNIRTWSMTDSRSLRLAFQKSISVAGQGNFPSSSGWAELFLSMSLIWWDHSITTDSTECSRLRSESLPLGIRQGGRGKKGLINNWSKRYFMYGSYRKSTLPKSVKTSHVGMHLHQKNTSPKTNVTSNNAQRKACTDYPHITVQCFHSVAIVQYNNI